MPMIEVLISPKGETSLQTKGYSGTDCLQASKWLEQALGIATQERMTSEAFQTAANRQHVEQQ